jgi:hypothetical protein
MKLLFRIALIALAAKLFMALPQGSSKELDKVGNLTVRDMAAGVSSVCNKIERKVSEAFSDATSGSKARPAHAAIGHRPAGS